MLHCVPTVFVDTPFVIIAKKRTFNANVSISIHNVLTNFVMFMWCCIPLPSNNHRQIQPPGVRYEVIYLQGRITITCDKDALCPLCLHRCGAVLPGSDVREDPPEVAEAPQRRPRAQDQREEQEGPGALPLRPQQAGGLLRTHPAGRWLAAPPGSGRLFSGPRRCKARKERGSSTTSRKQAGIFSSIRRDQSVKVELAEREGGLSGWHTFRCGKCRSEPCLRVCFGLSFVLQVTEQQSHTKGLHCNTMTVSLYVYIWGGTDSSIGAGLNSAEYARSESDQDLWQIKTVISQKCL